MAFPATIPAEGTYHEEGKQLFQVHGGRWKKRPGTVCLSTHQTNTSTPSIVFDDSGFEAINRVSMDIILIPDALAHIQMNFSDRRSGWIDCPGAYSESTGNLENGNSRWRKAVWDFAHTGTGFFLTWADNSWRLAIGKPHHLKIDYVALDNTDKAACRWTLMFANAAGTPSIIEGSVTVALHPKDLRQFVLNSAAQFSSCVIHAEIS